MGNRRRSREIALQALFEMDVSKDSSADCFAKFCRCFEPPERLQAFARLLVDGVRAHIDQIDHLIDEHSSNWKISRIAGVDRNIMRIAIFEMLYCLDIPEKVSINEAIDIGKKFGTEESGAFINGILDSIHLELQKEKVEAGNIETDPNL
jgi:N utilization substance protein B